MIFLGQRTTDNGQQTLSTIFNFALSYEPWALGKMLITQSSMPTANFKLSVFTFQLSILFGRSGYRRRAFRSIFARSVITSLAKDAAPIPNALDATSIKMRTWNQTVPELVEGMSSALRQAQRPHP